MTDATVLTEEIFPSLPVEDHFQESIAPYDHVEEVDYMEYWEVVEIHYTP